MFRRDRETTQPIPKTSVPTETSTTPKYPKPKILLIDLDNHCAEVLQDAGYNVSIGTFGIPYRVKRSSDLHYVSLSACRFPNYEEQEIVIANIMAPDPAGIPPTDEPGDGVEVYWQSGTNGLIDPRPLGMSVVRDAFDKILSHGGIFIVFAAAQAETTYYLGATHHLRGLRISAQENHSNWGFLSELMYLHVEDHYGYEITFEPELRGLTAILSRAQDGAKYYCTVRPGYHQRDYWIPLARNKYGEDVAGILLYKDPKGCIIILPQMPA
ncbi:MAG: hypothetical protein H5T92_00910, partial [Synergistales bacterium]|nr:hypothetical protein [Synergistales bacterium]